jgi:hypothetical protein
VPRAASFFITARIVAMDPCLLRARALDTGSRPV